MTLSLPRVAFAMASEVFAEFFHAEQLARLAEHTRVLSPRPLTEFDSPLARSVLAETDILITGWECPRVDAGVLAAAPDLRAIVHAAGTVKHHLDEVCWERGILVSSQAAANAIPVAEFTLAAILFAGKSVLPIARALSRERGAVHPQELFPKMGNYRKRVGIVGASTIGRLVIGLVKPFALEVAVYDPYLSASGARALGVVPLGLDELLHTSDIVSVHAPSLPETHHLIDAHGISLLRPGATIINTARGEIIDQDALIARIETGDLYAVLDVTTPWTLEADNPLYGHPNVLLTPHIAGSLGTELARLADGAVDEAVRFARGEALLHPVSAAQLARTA